MKYSWVFCAALMLPAVVTISQDKKYLSAEDSDPEATRMLEQMEKELTRHEAVTIHFSMTMAYPGEEPIRYAGTVLQQKDMFFIDAGALQIISDGKSRWIFDKEANEVNLYDATSADGPQTPLEMLQMYKENDYIYRITGEGEEASVPVQYIEFKPLDKGSELAKARLSVRTGDRQPVRLELFEKGGARTDLQIGGIEAGKVLPGSYYTFNAEEHPNVHIEDLRID
jgi:outer membrane lipoprotein-sorting protein